MSPRKRSDPWSRSSATLTNDSPRSSKSPSKAYREYPTPHPKKLAEAAGQFRNSQDGAGVRSSAASPRRQAEQPGAGPSRDADKAARVPRRAGLLRRWSPMDSGFSAGRTLSAAEEGEGDRRRRGNGGGRSGVVAELIQYGLRQIGRAHV